MARGCRIRTVRTSSMRCAPRAARAPITVVYMPNLAEPHSDLRQRLADVVAKYAPHATLEVLDPAALPERYAHLAAFSPTILAIRDGQVIAEAMGSSLPTRELDTVVRCAIEWPEA